MLTPGSEHVRYRAGRCASPDIAREVQIRQSVLDMYRDVLDVVAPTDEASARSVWCPACEGTGCAPDVRHTTTAEQIDARRPASDTSIDQCPVLPVDLARRVGAILDLRDPTATCYGFVGDDDLASVVIMAHARPRRVVLIERDPRISALVQVAADRAGVDLHVADGPVVVADQPLARIDPDLYESCDIVVTDPPYASDGMDAFVRTAAAMTRLGGVMLVAVPRLSTECWSAELLIEVEQLCLACGFVIESVRPSFAAYRDSEVVSSLVAGTRLTLDRPGPYVGDAGRFYAGRSRRHYRGDSLR